MNQQDSKPKSLQDCQNNLSDHKDPFSPGNIAKLPENQDVVMHDVSEKSDELEANENLVELECQEKEVNLDSSMGDGEVNGYSQNVNEPQQYHIHQN